MVEITEETGSHSVEPYSPDMLRLDFDGRPRLADVPIEWFHGEFSELTAAEVVDLKAAWDAGE